MADTSKMRARIREAVQSSDNVTELAKRVGVSRQQLYVWRDAEAEPSLHHAIAFADAMGWTLDYLTGRVDSPDERYSAAAQAERELSVIAADVQRLAESLRPTPRDDQR